MNNMTYKIYNELKYNINKNIEIDIDSYLTFKELQKTLRELELKHKKNKKLRILIDMDSVLVQDIKYALELYNNEHQTNLCIEDLKGWDIDNYVKKGTSILKYYREFGFFDKLEPMPNSIEVLKNLFNDGHEIIITTASPKTGVFDKMCWVEKYLPWLPIENFVSITKKNLIQADIILDDARHNLINASVIYPVMFYSYHNKDIKEFDKVHNWIEFEEYVEKVLESKS